MIDIILAIYNTPLNDLERCLNSIKDQTYKKWNAILIDDGSNEETREWLDTWSKNNNKFKVYHKKNEGVSIARNYGLKISKSDYIMFCDSDDTITNNCFEEAIDIMNNYNVDMIIGSMNLIFKEKEELHSSFKNVIFEKNTINDLIEYTLIGKNTSKTKELNNIYTGKISPKLYKKEIIKKMKFDEDLKMHEDNLFTLKIMKKCNKIYICNHNWYNYYQNDYSATHKKFSEIQIKQELLFCEKLYSLKDILNNNKKIETGLKIKMFYSICYYISYLKQCNRKEKNKYINLLLNFDLLDYISSLKINNYLNIKKKILLLILKIKNKKIKGYLLNLIIF